MAAPIRVGDESIRYSGVGFNRFIVKSWGIDNCSLYVIAGFVVPGLFYLKNVKAKIGKSQHLRYNRDSF